MGIKFISFDKRVLFRTSHFSTYLSHFMMRLRYPVALPEEVAAALGVDCSNRMKFKHFMQHLRCPSCRPAKLSRLMPRDRAEQLFAAATRQERFARHTLISYYFKSGWVEFILHFDNESRLRRMYLQHKDIPDDQGIEINIQ